MEAKEILAEFILRQSFPGFTIGFVLASPKPYATSGCDQNDLSDLWQESQMLQSLVRWLWYEIIATENARAA
ncbi:MAG: hypothetical protein V7K47_29960 [Nostoc sp.]